MPETTQFGNLGESSGSDGALKPNTILLARYKIMGQLGSGGFGAVYQARDLNFPDARRLVAVKEMLITASDPTLKSQTMRTFEREANILATLTHPAIPKIYDFFSQNDRAYIVMEYINGNDLEEILIKTRSLPVDKIIEWAIDLCDVLHYLHSYQPEPIIFRDMKPANVMIDSLGKVRLIDFGIAKIFVSGTKQTMIGTEGYSAPEQYKGNAEPQSDIYSLGATLHQIITRKDPRLELPFSFQDRPLKDYNDQVPDGLQEILDKALSFEPDQRYQTCKEMKEDLQLIRYQQAPRRGENGQPAASLQANTVNGQVQNNDQPTTDADGTSLFDEEGGGIEPKWTFETEDEIRSSPIVYKQYAIVGSYDTNIWVVSLETGEFIWKYPTKGGIAASPIIDEQSEQILVGSEDSNFYALNIHTGTENWTYTTNGKVRGTATMAQGYTFFGSDDGKLYALLTREGKHMWSYDTGAPVRSAPFITDNRVIVGSEAGVVVGLELNGQRKWEFRTKKKVLSSPFVDLEGVCYVGAFDGYMYAMDAEKGYSHWRFRTNGPITSSPVVERNLIYFGSADGKLYCVNTHTGREKWKYETNKPIVASPIVHKGIVYFGGVDGVFYAVEAKTGREIWKFQTGNSITAAPYITDDLILISSMDTRLYALPLVAYQTT